MSLSFREMPIRRKLVAIILMTSAVVMVLLFSAFFTYEIVTIRSNMLKQAATLGSVIASNSTAALAFQNQDDASEVLASLAAERRVREACIYDKAGRVFARYPATASAYDAPRAPGPDGFHYNGGRLRGFQPVIQGGSDRLGTLFTEYDSGAVISQWLRATLAIGAAAMLFVLTVAYLLSRLLQRQVSEPILALAQTARSISGSKDYSVRAPRLGGGELGLLTDDFNQMLGQLQELNVGLERQVALRTHELEGANADLTRSRAEINNLFESLPGLYIVLTTDLCVVTASDAYLQAMQITRAAAEGKNIFEIFPDNPDDPTATGTTNLRSSFERVLRTSAADTMAIQKYDVRTPDGVFVERFWSPINSPVVVDGKVKYIIHRVEEVTDFMKSRASTKELRPEVRDRMERMEAEMYKSSQQIQATNRQLESANKELEAFSYSVSHDLRAPLRHVDGFAALLSKHAGPTLDEKGRRLLDTISKSAKQMGRLIDDLLDFSRTGRTELRMSTVDQDSVLASVIREGAFDREDRKIGWLIKPLAQVRADAGLMRQVWANLIQNAVKYSGTNVSPTVEVGNIQGSSEGEVVYFVKDNGVGFDMKYVDKLFGVFQRLHAASEFEGTGIGLANVRRIVARHGGRAWAVGEVGKGATFFFSLPAGLAGPGSAGSNGSN